MRILLKFVFAAGLAVGLVMALTPNLHNAPHGFLPEFLRRWVNQNDDAANVTAFFLIASVGLRLPSRGMHSGHPVRAKALTFLAHPIGRVVAFLVLVSAIELAQIFIPGRVSDLQDVCTGWSGIFAAWLFYEVHPPRPAG